MDEELEASKEEVSKVQTSTSSETEQKQELDLFPRIEDLIKSEKEVKKAPPIKGVTQVEQKIQTEDRVFSRKSDQRKQYMQKRQKIVKSVYLTTVVLLLTLLFVNLGTLISMDRTITKNIATKQAQQKQIEMLENQTPQSPQGNIPIDLNLPRDYDDDKKELTFLDKVTIVFKNLFS